MFNSFYTDLIFSGNLCSLFSNFLLYFGNSSFSGNFRSLFSNFRSLSGNSSFSAKRKFFSLLVNQEGPNIDLHPLKKAT
jgi:hypothetical protein